MLAFFWLKKPKSSYLTFSSLQHATSNATLLVGARSSLFRKILIFPVSTHDIRTLGAHSFTCTGTMAAAYVNGLQSRGVAATIKHFVANDQESQRTAANSAVSDRALREVYPYPCVISRLNCGPYLFLLSFMLAQRDAKPWAYMTSYVEMV